MTPRYRDATILQIQFPHMRFTPQWMAPVLAFLTVTTAFAQTSDAAEQPSLTSFTLANGMQLLVVETQDSAWVHWEMVLDTPPFLEATRAGLQEVAVATMSKGSEGFTQVELEQGLTDLDAQLELSPHGFKAVAPSVASGDLMRLVSDAVLRPSLSQEGLDAVKKVMHQKLDETETSTRAAAANLGARTSFGPLHPYGEIMTHESLEAITRKDLVTFHATYFRPNAAYLLVVGDIAPDVAYARANAHFGQWTRGSIPYTRIMPSKLSTGRQVRFVPMEGAAQSSVIMVHPVAFPPGHPDGPAVHVMNAMLNTNGHSVSLVSDPVTARFEMTAETDKEETADAIASMVAHLESFKNSTDSVVLQQVKTKLTEEHIARMGDAKHFAQQALDIRLHDLPEDHFATYTERLAMVSVNDVQRVARNMIRTNNMNVCVAGAPEILEGIRVFDAGKGVDQYNVFAQRQTPRTEAPAGTTVASVLDRHFDAIGGAKAWSKIRTLQTFGSVEYSGGMSLSHSETIRFGKKNKALKSEMAMAGQAVITQVVTQAGGKELQMGKITDMDSESVAIALERISPTRLLQMEKNGFAGKVLGMEEVEGQPSVLLEFARDGVQELYWFSATDGMLLQRSRPALDRTVELEKLDFYIAFGENGLKFPTTRRTVKAGQSMVFRTGNVVFGPELSDSDFVLEK